MVKNFHGDEMHVCVAVKLLSAAVRLPVNVTGKDMSDIVWLIS